MAQTIKIRRGGIGTLATTTPGSIGSGIASGELILGTGSFNGLTGPLLLAANATNVVSPAYSRIDTIADGPALESAIGASGDINLTGLTIHSGSKFYRYSGVNSTGFEELTVSAGSFEGDYVASITDATNNGITISGGTGNASTPSIILNLNDLTSATITPADDSIAFVDLDNGGTRKESVVDFVSAIAGTNTAASSGQLIVADASDSVKGVVELATAAEASTGTSTTLAVTPAGLTQFIADATGSIAASSTDLVNSGVINSLSASIATDINANTGNVEGVTGQVAYFDDTNSVSGSTGFTFADNVLTVGTSTFGTNTTIAGDLTVNGTTTTINSTTVNIDDNIIVVNYGGSAATAGIHAIDATGVTTATGSLVWDGNNTKDWWKAGPKGSEKRVVTFNDNGGGTDTAIQRLDSDSHLVDSSLTDDGTTVTVASNVDLTLQGTGQLTVPEAVLFTGLTVTDSGAATDEVLFVQTDGTVGQIDASATTDEMVGILGYKSSGGMTFSTLIDGGTF